MTTKRVVYFVEHTKGGGAVITWGNAEANRYNCPISELSRTAEPQLDARYFPNGRPFEVPRLKTPPTQSQLDQRIASARTKLRATHRRAKEAKGAVTEARALADRAQDEVNAAYQALAQCNAADERINREVEAAIRCGKTPNYNGPDRAPVTRRVKSAEAALDNLNKDLASANLELAEANNDVKASARAVIAAVVARSCEAARAIEQLATLARADLAAAAAARFGGMDLLRLDEVAKDFIGSAPALGADAREWLDLFDRLVAFDADADMQTTVTVSGESRK